MKKNGQYVGVDEKYIPDDEKYVDESVIGASTNEIANNVKEYLSDDKNKEKTKKIIKGVGIGYLAVVLFIFIIAIVVFVFIFMNFIKINNRINENQSNFSVMDDIIK